MNVPPSFKSNQQAYHRTHDNCSDTSFNQNQPHVVVVLDGVQCHNGIPQAAGGIGREGSGRHRGSGNASCGDRNGSRKGSVLWAIAKNKLFPGRRSKQLAVVKMDPKYSQEHDDVEPKSTGTASPLPPSDTSPGPNRNVNQLPQQDSSNKAYEDLKATIQQLQSNLERERKIVQEYHEDWEESQMEALKLKEYVGLLQDHTRKLQEVIVRLNQEHSLNNFRQVPRLMPELPFLCPVDLHLPEDYSRVGKYKRGRLLGQGQFGIVWEATLHRPTNNSQDSSGTSCRKRHNKERVFAIKEIDKGRLNAYRKLVALNREVQALQVCQHPNIIHLVGVFHGPKSFYMVFEKAWMDAHTLIRAFPTLPMVTLRRIMKAVFRALQHIHANGVAHLDVKPENILIVHPDHGGRGDDRHAAGILQTEHVRLGDFGLCVIDKNRQQQQQQQQLQLSQQRQLHHHQPYRHNNLYYHGDMPEFNVGDNSFMSPPEYRADHHRALGNRRNDDAPSLYEQGCTVIGTPGFYAPEMAEREHFDAMAADMWSAGTCLMEFTIGLKDFWWNTYEQYGQHRRRLRRRGSQRGGVPGPPDSDGFHAHSAHVVHPHAPVKQSTAASSKSTFKLGEELYWYLETLADMEWSDNCLKDFVLNKLMVEPESRSTASQALGNPWMASPERRR